MRLDPDTGELCVRGPLLFDGYYGNPEATARALQDGWYRTGDLAAVDDEGYLRIVGRAHDVIRTGGESVVPTEVEAVLAGPAGRGRGRRRRAARRHLGRAGVRRRRRRRARRTADPGSGARALHAASSPASSIRGRCACVDRLPRTPATGQLQRRLIVEALVKEAQQEES